MDDAAPPPSAPSSADGAPNPDVRQEPRDPPLDPPPLDPPPGVEPAALAPSGLASLDLLTADQRQMLEQLSLNLSKAASTVQTAITGAAVRAAGAGAAANPDPFHVGPAMGQVVQSLTSSPDKLMKAQANLFERYVDLWRVTAARAAGETAPDVATPLKGDKRFKDADWTENPVFDVMKQSYLVTSGWLNELVAGAEGVDPMAKRRVEFFTKLLTDAFSPSNYLATNPAALRRPAGDPGREPAARRPALRRRPRAGRRQAGHQPDRLRQVQGGRERRHRARQGRVPERPVPAAAVLAHHRAGARDAAADLPALDQQVLHPGPEARRTR